jgi:hypothetical protein
LGRLFSSLLTTPINQDKSASGKKALIQADDELELKDNHMALIEELGW